MERFSKLRYNLTLIYTLVTAAITIIVAMVLYLGISVSLENSTASNLKITARQIAGIYELSLSNTAEAEQNSSYEELKKNLEESAISYLIWDDNLTLVDRSDDLLVDQSVLMYYLQDYFRQKQMQTQLNDYRSTTEDVKICTYAYVLSSGKMIVIQDIKDMSLQRSVLQQPVRIIYLTIILGVLLSAVGGYFLSWRALLPIKESYQMQRDFLADASHELRTPVSVIQTNLEVLKNHPDQPIKAEMDWVENAYSETKRMKEVVENLLTLAKADAGEQITEFEPVDLSYLLMEITERLTPIAQKKQINLQLKEMEAELFVSGAHKQLSELFTILIDNAIKYTNPGGNIWVSAKANGNRILVRVEDSGIGIAKDQIERIFERFYRVDKARSRQEGGTGLGLSIAKWICEMHQAQIQVISTENIGTTFTVSFPMYE